MTTEDVLCTRYGGIVLPRRIFGKIFKFSDQPNKDDDFMKENTHKLHYNFDEWFSHLSAQHTYSTSIPNIQVLYLYICTSTGLCKLYWVNVKNSEIALERIMYEIEHSVANMASMYVKNPFSIGRQISDTNILLHTVCVYGLYGCGSIQRDAKPNTFINHSLIIRCSRNVLLFKACSHSSRNNTLNVYSITNVSAFSWLFSGSFQITLLSNWNVNRFIYLKLCHQIQVFPPLLAHM